MKKRDDIPHETLKIPGWMEKLALESLEPAACIIPLHRIGAERDLEPPAVYPGQYTRFTRL